MFVASPDGAEAHQAGVTTEAIGTFDHVSVENRQTDGTWRGIEVGSGPRPGQSRVFRTRASPAGADSSPN